MNNILGSHFEEMTSCETIRLGALSCLVFCLPQRMLHGNVKTFDVICKKMEEESGAVKLALESHILFIFGLCYTGKMFQLQ